MTCRGSKVKTRQDYDFFHTTMRQIQKFEVFLRRGIFISSFRREKKKIIMSIAEEERECQGSNEPTRENSVCLMQQVVCKNWQQGKLVIAGVLCWKVRVVLKDNALGIRPG